MNNFHFTNLTDIKYGTLTYNWDFGDGMTDTLITSMHSYTASGNYRARLTALSNNGCKDTASKLLTVGAMPFVSFSINDPGQCLLTQDFIYNNTTTLGLGTMTSFWQFGDGDTSTTLNARHIYPATGNYNPKLIMTSNYGCVDSISQSIWVNPNAQVSFVVNDSDQCQNQQHFVFTNTSSLSSGNIIDLLWNLDNGQGSDQEQVLAYYPLSGTYTISLQTTTDSGCIDSFQNSIRVYPKPLARFDVNDSAQCLFDNNYVFTDASFDSLGLNQYNWNINNEVMYATSMVNYVFSTIGYKDITLIATSLRGCSDTIKREVYVKPMPDPSFEKLKEYYCVNTGPFSFITTSPGGNFTGKNIQSELYKPIVLWQDTVEYKVTVNGCTDSSMQITQVYPDPNADLGNDTTICKYEMVELAVQSWQSNFVWNNGSTLPTLLVDKAGKYWVQVSNICGVQGDTIAVSILPVNCRFFLPTAFSPNKDGINDRYKPVIFDVSEMHYQIYTRWGELIFEGNQDDQGWDGSYKGQPAQDGTYLIIVTYAYKGGLQYLRFSETGTFLLLR
jgi:gliding motility-associated-like protein